MAKTSRRNFFSTMVDGIHGAALASLLGPDLIAGTPAVYDLKPKPQQFPARAKSVIHLFMNGGPSQVDLFDPKPMLEKFAGQPPSRDIANDILFVGDVGGMMPSPFKSRTDVFWKIWSPN